MNDRPTRHDPSDDDLPPAGSLTVADVLRRWRYTLAPTLYTHDEEQPGPLLWQLVLEARAVRAWLVVVSVTLLLLLAVGVTLVLTVTTS